ncbi:adenosylcobinamide-GDP ribazoletransferase, partial [Nocardia nova]|uniref:adenosylcobinamide-GDP ribazoletransferase n=1 Tax=Nocardia nova TaxID=37330 RepID=UPI0025B191F1
VLACRGYASAPGAGFGALVARTQSAVTPAVWTLAALVVGVFAAPESWLGLVAVAVALAGAALLVWHCVGRFGGLNGDVLGAAVEVTVAVTAAVLSLS